MRFAARSHVGLVRKVNEDGYKSGVDPAGVGIVIVADGMGGALAGEVASSIAVASIWDALTAHANTRAGSERLTHAIDLANTRIYEEASRHQEFSGMGTTIVAVLAEQDTLTIAHVGDSRAYILRRGGERMEQVTIDHSYVNELVRRGQIRPEEAATHPQRHVLMRTLGTLPVVPVDCKTIGWEIGDLLLVCSDGLSGYLSDDEMFAIAQQQLSMAARADALVDAALAAGGLDNVTVALLAHDGDVEWRSET